MVFQVGMKQWCTQEAVLEEAWRRNSGGDKETEDSCMKLPSIYSEEGLERDLKICSRQG